MNKPFPITEKNVLICMVGLPYSGKTTRALEISADLGAPIVCPDAIRMALHGERFIASAERQVWATAHYMVDALFMAGHTTVILDATNGTRKRRADWYKCKAYSTAFCPVYGSQVIVNHGHAFDFAGFEAFVDVCIARAQKAGDEYIIDIIRRMAGDHQPLARGALEEKIYVHMPEVIVTIDAQGRSSRPVEIKRDPDGT